MRNHPPMNEYQQLLLSALALVDEADLVAILRAARKHPKRNHCIDLVNAELDKGVNLWSAFADPSPLNTLFENDWPELRVSFCMEQRTISMEFGTNGPPSDILCWQAHMGATGVVKKLEEPDRYWPEGIPPRLGPVPKGYNPFDRLGLR